MTMSVVNLPHLAFHFSLEHHRIHHYLHLTIHGMWVFPGAHQKLQQRSQFAWMQISGELMERWYTMLGNFCWFVPKPPLHVVPKRLLQQPSIWFSLYRSTECTYKEHVYNAYQGVCGVVYGSGSLAIPPRLTYNDLLGEPFARSVIY